MPVIRGVFAMSCLYREFICTQGSCDDGVLTLDHDYHEHFIRKLYKYALAGLQSFMTIIAQPLGIT